MSKSFCVDAINETITISASFQKKLSKNDPETYNIYADLKKKYPNFKFAAAQKAKRVGAYDHTTMEDIKAYLEQHKQWQKEFDELFGELVPSKTNACKTVRKAKFVTIRAWFVRKRQQEEQENSEKAVKKAGKVRGKAGDASEFVNINTINEEPLKTA